MKQEPLDYDRIYEYRFRNVDQERKDAVWREIAVWLHARLGHPERLLDPAAGTLEFLRAVPAKERWGVDLRPPLDPARAEGIRHVTGDALTVELPESYFDAVFLSNFLEHLRSPEEAYALLVRMRRSLRPGGRVACMGPNFRFCAGEYFDCADHRLALTNVSVEELLFAAGLEIEESIPRFLPFSFRSRLPSHPLLTRLYLRAPLAWRFLGQQFLVVGKRPRALGNRSIDGLLPQDEDGRAGAGRHLRGEGRAMESPTS